jgi:hypothetical protein
MYITTTWGKNFIPEEKNPKQKITIKKIKVKIERKNKLKRNNKFSIQS